MNTKNWAVGIIGLFFSLQSVVGQNTLDNLNISASSPSQVAYSLRQLSSSYSGAAMVVRRSTDNAEGVLAFDATQTPHAVTMSSQVTLLPGVTLTSPSATAATGTITTRVAKTGTITVQVNRTGTVSYANSTGLVTGSGTAFTTELAVGDQLFNSVDGQFIGIVKTIHSDNSLSLRNFALVNGSGQSFRTRNAVCTGAGTTFDTELSVGDRLFKDDGTYLGTVAGIASATLLTLEARDAVAASSVAFFGTSATVTGSGTSFNISLAGKMLISNNATLGIVQSVESATSLTLTGKAGAALNGASFSYTNGSVSLSAFSTSASVFVKTWYDQSGNGRNATQPVAANQPRLINNGTLHTMNGKPAVDFSATTANNPFFLQTATPADWLNNTLYTLNIVTVEPSPISSYQIGVSTTGGNGPSNSVLHYGYRTGGQYTVAQYGNDQNFEVFATNEVELHTAVKSSISSSRYYHNGAYLGQLTSGNGANLSDLSLLNIGYYTPIKMLFKGMMAELTVYALAMNDTDREAMNTNQLSYYGISTIAWTGDQSTDWNTTGNWSGGVVPTASAPSLVVIPNGKPRYPVITSEQTIPLMNLMVESAATVTVEGTLQVHGTLSNAATNRITATNGTIEFKGVSAQSLLANTFASNTVKILKINCGTNVVLTLNGQQTVSNAVEFAGTYAGNRLYFQSGSTLTLGGSISYANGGLLRGNSNASLVVTGTPTLDFDQATNGGTNILRNLTVNSTGAITLASNLIINTNGTLTFTAGKLTIGANTLTVRGGVTNTTPGGLSGGSTSNLVLEGLTNRTLSFDQTTPGTTNWLNNFTINTTASNSITAANSFGIDGTLTVATGQTLDMDNNSLGGTLNTVALSGTLKTASTASAPLPEGKTWSGMVEYDAAAAQKVAGGTYNHLTINSTGGAQANGDLTVNGILHLATNPNETNGTLEMTKNYNDYSNILTPVDELTTRHTADCDILDSYILTMGASATHTGTGDVTGRVKRTSLTANTEYTFGSPYTSISFSSGGTLPSQVMFVITKGSDRGIHANLTTTVARLYQVIQTDGAGITFTMKLRYLESELNSNDAAQLVLWDHHILYSSADTPHEHGKTAINNTEGWISLAGHDITYLAINEEVGGFSKYWMMKASQSTDGTRWLGSVGSQWNNLSNWTVGGGIPGADSKVIIPAVPNSPTLPASGATAKSVTIEQGATLNGGEGTLTLKGGPASNGGAGSWSNHGTFNPGTSTVVFDYTEATCDGTTDFYNVTIPTGKKLTLQSGSLMQVGGTLTMNGTLDAAQFDNTIAFNGGAQSLVNPNGSTGGYRNLTLSGTGIKSMPSGALSIAGDLTLAGTAQVTTAGALTIGGNMLLGNGTTFNAESSTHLLSGDFTNNGATLSATQCTLNFQGNDIQTVGGTSPTAFGDVVIDNASGVEIATSATVDQLTINSGKLLVVNSGKSLTAQGNTTLGSAECLVLKSDATGTASFIDNGTIGGVGTCRAERYLTPYDVVSDLKFHFLSSPVGNTQSVEPEWMDLTSPAITDFYRWSEPDNLWVNFRGQTFEERNEAFGDDFKLMAGKGYLVAYPEAVVKNFVGQPFTSSSGLAVACSNTGGRGWNLAGNPFPSSVDWDLVTKGDGMDAALYYYDNATPGYKYYVQLSGGLAGGTRYIAPMQGFMTHAKTSGSKVITLANNARSHQGASSFFKEVQLQSNIVDLLLEGPQNSDAARVCFFDQATDLFDGDYDAYKLFSYSQGTSEIYSLAHTGSPLAINTLPLPVAGRQVPLQFNCGHEGDYTITAQRLETFGNAVSVTLVDLLIGQSQLLTQHNAYTFNASPGDDPNRFVLQFGAVGVNQPNTETYTGWAIYQDGAIKLFPGVVDMRAASLYDLSGREICRWGNNSSQQLSLRSGLTTGWYLLKITLNNHSTASLKILIH